MGFYEDIAAHYDHIFPLGQTRVDFVTRHLPPPPPSARVVDLGCGTGALARALAARGHAVLGLDLDAAMIARAQEAATGLTATFAVDDMAHVASHAAPASLAAVLCFGNTLPHLAGPAAVFELAGRIRSALRRHGSFLVQLINYDDILAQRPPGLATIDNEFVRFERRYEYRNDGRIDFSATLTVKAAGASTTNSVTLYPLRHAELDTALRRAGFSEVVFLGTYADDPWCPSSDSTIIRARR